MEGEWSDAGPDHFTLGKELLVPINSEAGGPHSQFGHFGEDTNLFALLAIERFFGR
jgi:hypothetical protein